MKFNLYLILGLLMAVDCITTFAAIRRKKGSEGNEYMLWVLTNLGDEGLLAIKAVFMIGLWYLLPQIHMGFLLALIAGMAWVCWQNWRIAYPRRPTERDTPV